MKQINQDNKACQNYWSKSKGFLIKILLHLNDQTFQTITSNKQSTDLEITSSQRTNHIRHITTCGLPMKIDKVE